MLSDFDFLSPLPAFVTGQSLAACPFSRHAKQVVDARFSSIRCTRRCSDLDNSNKNAPLTHTYIHMKILKMAKAYTPFNFNFLSISLFFFLADLLSTTDSSEPPSAKRFARSAAACAALTPVFPSRIDGLVRFRFFFGGDPGSSRPVISSPSSIVIPSQGCSYCLASESSWKWLASRWVRFLPKLVIRVMDGYGHNLVERDDENWRWGVKRGSILWARLAQSARASDFYGLYKSEGCEFDPRGGLIRNDSSDIFFSLRLGCRTVTVNHKQP